MNDILVKKLGLSLDDIVKEIQTLSADIAGNRESLVKAFIRYDEASRVVKNASLWQFGLSPNQKLFELIDQTRQSQTMKEKAVREIATQYLDIFKRSIEGGMSKRLTHNDQRELLESSLKLLVNFEKEVDGKIEPETYALIARTYLFRSAIMLPKGFTVPEKKKEALRKGLEFIRMIDNPDKEAMRIRGSLLLEQRHIDTQEKDSESNGDNQTLIKELREALENGCDKINDTIEDVRIALYYIELTGEKKDLLQKIINSTLDFPGIELYRIKAYYLKGDYHAIDDEALKKELSGIRFGHPVWSEAMYFIKQIKDANVDCWRKLALAAYSVCRMRESEASSLHLRWYWSGYRLLYDLAFIAEDDSGKKAEIADSLKSRVALHAKALDEIFKQGEERDAYYEAHAVAYAGGYVKEAGKIHTGERRTDLGANDVFKELPDSVAVVVFYLNHTEKSEGSLGRGYALIAKNGTWDIRNFPFDSLYKAYLTWQTNYSRYKESASSSLIELCKEIGRAMPFLFKIDMKQVVFIPHDFLHRIPLHAAIRKNAVNNIEEVFLKEHQCYYLPAWSFAGKEDTSANLKGRVVFNGFSKIEEAHKVLSELKWEECNDFEKISDPPKLFLIGSHGKADAANPFNSRLKRAEGDITLLATVKSKMNIKGSCVIIGACESDLVPPLSGPLDEYLSFASTLLLKNAREILGEMWIVFLEDIVEIITRIDNSGHGSVDIGAELWCWQKENVEKGIREYQNGDSTLLFRSFVFRIFGLPQKIPTKKTYSSEAAPNPP